MTIYLSIRHSGFPGRRGGGENSILTSVARGRVESDTISSIREWQICSLFEIFAPVSYLVEITNSPLGNYGNGTERSYRYNRRTPFNLISLTAAISYRF